MKAALVSPALYLSAKLPAWLVGQHSADSRVGALVGTGIPKYEAKRYAGRVKKRGTLRREHRTKPGVWGVIRVLEGQLRFEVIDPGAEVVILEAGTPGLVLPEQPHRVEPLGPLRMQVEFYREAPEL